MKLLPVFLCLALLTTLTSAAFAEDVFDPNGHGAKYPASANGTLTSRPTLRAYHLNGYTIELDGRLDEAAWSAPDAATGFVQIDPDRGADPTEQTVFKVVYDEEAIYLGVACYENDVANTSSSLCRRDQIDNSDIVSVYIDPYHDKTTGYNFRVNPHGVLADAYIFDDGNRDWDWNAVWEAETWSDEHGWYAEMRIPFSSIRYRPAESMTWGLQVYRWMHGRGEDTGWVSWDRETSGFVSRFGELTGIKGVRPPRQLEILPYIVLRGTDPAIEGDGDQWDRFQNIGTDIKYGVTADLTLNAAIQPDFGQVEADPAVLNLSPFETFYQEKRPFFIEGARFFEHSDFNLFYSRRIGTGDENSRIRAAGKLTGKTAGDISVAALFAATDVTSGIQAINPFESGTDQTYYGVARIGKEFNEGNHRVNLMQTIVKRSQQSRWVDGDLITERDAYTSGFDFEMNFKDRMYHMSGSFVGTIVDPDAVQNDPTVDHAAKYGNGGSLGFSKSGGKFRGSVYGRWESDKLDPNDLGFLRAPDEYNYNGWVQYRFDSDGEEESFLRRGNINLNWYESMLFTGRSVDDPDNPGQALWSYDSGHRQNTGWNVNGWCQTRSFWQLNGGFWMDLEGSSKYATRDYNGVRGPLMTTPNAYGGWVGVNTDWRKAVMFNVELNLNTSEVGTSRTGISVFSRWNQNASLNHRLSVGYNSSHSDAQWLNNFENVGGGIGDISYVFGELDQQTFDITLRSNVLFDRNKSLEIYMQPFLTMGDYSNARQLMQPDSYDLQSYTADGFNETDSDFSYGAVNLNVVYRWEYRPGSTFFLVWTHNRSSYTERGESVNPGLYDNGFGTSRWFRNEAENTVLMKFSYWFSI